MNLVAAVSAEFFSLFILNDFLTFDQNCVPPPTKIPADAHAWKASGF